MMHDTQHEARIIAHEWSPREIDITARLFFDAWEIMRFDPDVTVGVLLRALVAEAPAYVPEYIVERVREMHS